MEIAAFEALFVVLLPFPTGFGCVFVVFCPSIFFSQSQENVPVLIQHLSLCIRCSVTTAKPFPREPLLFSPFVPALLCALQNTTAILPHVGFFLSWIASNLLHIWTQASKLSCNSVFVPLSTLVWHFGSSACVHTSSFLF